MDDFLDILDIDEIFEVCEATGNKKRRVKHRKDPCHDLNDEEFLSR